MSFGTLLSDQLRNPGNCKAHRLITETQMNRTANNKGYSRQILLSPVYPLLSTRTILCDGRHSSFHRHFNLPSVGVSHALHQ
jgi:hypothetical protein